MQFSLHTVAPGDADALENLNSFLRGHRILTVDRQWTGAAWNLCIAYEGVSHGGTTSGTGTGGAANARPEKVDYKTVLDAHTFARFSRLREVRKKLAERDSLPAYAVFTNEQLAAIAALPSPVTKAAMKTVEGVGDARLEKYALPMLDALDTADKTDGPQLAKPAESAAQPAAAPAPSPSPAPPPAPSSELPFS